MKRVLITALTVAVSVTAFAQTAPPREPAPVDTVSVTGTARVTTTPDRFSFNVSVQTIAPTVEEAVNENNAKVAAVIAALKLRTTNGKGRHLSTRRAIALLEEHGVETPDGHVRAPAGLLPRRGRPGPSAPKEMPCCPGCPACSAARRPPAPLPPARFRLLHQKDWLW